jgi:hypothetical protein
MWVVRRKPLVVEAWIQPGAAMESPGAHAPGNTDVSVPSPLSKLGASSVIAGFVVPPSVMVVLASALRPTAVSVAAAQRAQPHVTSHRRDSRGTAQGLQR